MVYSLQNKRSMVDIISAICAGRAAIISLFSVISGTILNYIPADLTKSTEILLASSVNSWWFPPTLGDALQWAAWVIAILAGIVSIINGAKNWFCTKKIKKNGYKEQD